MRLEVHKREEGRRVIFMALGGRNGEGCGCESGKREKGS